MALISPHIDQVFTSGVRYASIQGNLFGAKSVGVDHRRLGLVVTKAKAGSVVKGTL